MRLKMVGTIYSQHQRSKDGLIDQQEKVFVNN